MFQRSVPSLFKHMRSSSDLNQVLKLHMKSTALLVCDMQEKFRSHISNFETVTANCQRAIQSAQIMQLPIIVTEQYPSGLGHTIPELKEALTKVGGPSLLVEKTKFSMACDQVNKKLAKHNIDSLIVVGIEAHVCILQTVLEFLNEDFEINIPVDAISSRSLVDRKYGLKRARDAGAYLTTLESVVFQLFKDANHSKFKEAQNLFKTLLPPIQ